MATKPIRSSIYVEESKKIKIKNNGQCQMTLDKVRGDSIIQEKKLCKKYLLLKLQKLRIKC